jgi:hypothetical protein
MVQKPAAYNRDPASNAFADDDPLAELARLVGYDAPFSQRTTVQRAEPPRVDPEFSEPAANTSGAGYGATHQPVDLQDELLHDMGGYVDHRAAQPAYEPVSFGGNAVGRVPVEDGVDSQPDLADELLWSMNESVVEPQHDRSGGSDPSNGYGSHRLPLANFNPVRSSPTHHEDPPMQRRDQEPQAFASEPVAYAAPVERYREPEFDVQIAQQQRMPEVSFPVEPEHRSPPVAFQEPVFEAPAAPRREMPNFFEERAYEDEVAPTQSPLWSEPQMAPDPVVEDTAEDDFFGGDLELDLAEIELDLSEIEPEPVVSQPAPRPVAVEPPVQRETVMPREPIAQPSFEAARPQPVSYQAAAEPVEQPVPPLPFDAAAISDQDEQLEMIAHLDVPDLPPPDVEKPVSYTSSYDFDIDSELANLLDQTAGQHQTQPSAPARAMPATAAAVPPMAEQVRAMPSDDFDVFEKALEEDFRRSLDTQYSFGSKQAGPPPEVIEEDDYEEDEPSSARRWIAIAAAAAVVLVAGGGVFAWIKSDGGEVLGGGEPKIVMADKDPVKVVPANPGGKSVPNQNKAVYDRVSGTGTDQPAQKNLISSDEEPMDVAQRTLAPDNLPMDDEAGADNADTSAADGAAKTDNQGLSPRRVKTMIVRPDGSLVAQDDVAANTQTGNSTAAAAPALAAPSASGQAASGQSVGDLLASGDTQPAAPADVAQTEGVPAPNMPVPLARPTQTASAAPARPAPAAQSSAPVASVASTATAPGDYLIQISSLPTEADAQKSYKNLSGKYSSVIGGRGMNIKAADVAGKGTYYRVRIPAGSKDAAVSLCERYRAAGGSCMVVR